MPNFTKQLPPSRKQLKFLAILTLLVLVGLGALWSYRALSVATIECAITNGDTCDQQVQKQLEHLYGEPLFFNDLHARLIQKSQLTTDEIVALKKKLPRSVSVTLAPAAPIYRICTSGECRVVLSTGRTIPDAQDKALPTVTSPTQTENQNRILEEHAVHPLVHEHLKAAIVLLAHEEIVFTSLELMTDTTLAIPLQSGQTALVTLPLETTKARQLKIILTSPEQLTSIPGEIGEIDVRFRLPVLRTRRTEQTTP